MSTKKNTTLDALIAPTHTTKAAKTSAKAAQVALTTSASDGTKLKTPKPATKIVGFRLRLDTHQMLKQASVDDSIPAAARVQALLDLLAEDDDLAERVRQRATS